MRSSIFDVFLILFIKYSIKRAEKNWLAEKLDDLNIHNKIYK